MPKFTLAALMDAPYDVIRAAAATVGRVKLHVLKAYTAGDSYATVIGNSCGSFDMVAADFVASTSGVHRRQTVAAKAVTLSASSGAGPNLHIAIVDSVNNVVWDVTDETTDQVLTSPGTFNVPSWYHDFDQPT